MPLRAGRVEAAGLSPLRLLMLPARLFVLAVFALLGAAFVASTAMLIGEFRAFDWRLLVFTHSHLFFFFPVLGLAALACFYVPAVVLTDLYWRGGLRAGKARYFLGFLVVSLAAAGIAWQYASDARRGVWEVAPAALAADLRAAPAVVPDCRTPAGGPCLRIPILSALAALREAGMHRPTITEFARVCVPDPLVEATAAAAALRHCFPAGTRLDAAGCCRVQDRLASDVRMLWQAPATRSRLAGIEAVVTGLKAFFVIIVNVVGIMLLVWSRHLVRDYHDQLEAIERGVIVGAALMLVWLLMDYGYQQTVDVLYGRQTLGVPLRASLVIGLLAVGLIFYFLQRIDGRVFNLAQILTAVGSLVALVNYEFIGNKAARVLGSGAETFMFAGLIVLAGVAVGLVHGPWKLPLPPMRGVADEDAGPFT